MHNDRQNLGIKNNNNKQDWQIMKNNKDRNSECYSVGLQGREKNSYNNVKLALCLYVFSDFFCTSMVCKMSTKNTNKLAFVQKILKRAHTFMHRKQNGRLISWTKG